MKEKNKIKAIVGSAIFHLLILLMLYFSGFSREIPQEEGGIEIIQGYVDDASGNFFPNSVTNMIETESPLEPSTDPISPPVDDALISQNLEESLDAKQDKEEKRKFREELQEKKIRDHQIAEEHKKQEELKKRAEAAAQNVANAFTNSGKSSNNGQNLSDKGLQGSLTGSSSKGAPKGVGYGYGLEGFGERGIKGGLVEPRYKGEQSGRIRFYLIVDSGGKVISAEISSGTTISDVKMRESAYEAIMKQSFDVSSKEKQEGYFVFIYDKL